MIDREVLSDQGKREYGRIIAGPIKQAVASARKRSNTARPSEDGNFGHSAVHLTMPLRYLVHRDPDKVLRS